MFSICVQLINMPSSRPAIRPSFPLYPPHTFGLYIFTSPGWLCWPFDHAIYSKLCFKRRYYRDRTFHHHHVLDFHPTASPSITLHTFWVKGGEEKSRGSINQNVRVSRKTSKHIYLFHRKGSLFLNHVFTPMHICLVSKPIQNTPGMEQSIMWKFSFRYWWSSHQVASIRWWKAGEI